MTLPPSPAAATIRTGKVKTLTLRTASGTIIPVTIAPNYTVLSAEVARQLAGAAHETPAAVLGLATGSTPIGVYDALVRLVQSGDVDTSRLTSFNLDEYYPMEAGSPHSYHTFMREHLFDRLAWGKWHVPSGRLRAPQVINEDCQAYEDAIRHAGGIDLQLLGIGRTGHIGFNEPGSPKDSRTRLVELSSVTRDDASETFGNLDLTPRQAVSMGIGTILEARGIILMGTGSGKAAIIREAFRQPIKPSLPASYLQLHPGTSLYLDAAAAAEIL